jgi:predicted dehydrogenase
MTGALPSGRELEQAASSHSKPRLGFLGVGWIGRNRLDALARSGLAEIAAVADPSPSNLSEAGKITAGAEQFSSLDALLNLDLDGIVIATPSALHAEQAIACLDAGLPVFCQKPLARTRKETERVVQAARRSNCLLAVDLSYRFTTGVQRIRKMVQAGEMGKVFALDLVFHNAYGPDKAWFYDYQLSGGGCLIDLGIHLVDLAFWLLGNPSATTASGRLFAGGELLPPGCARVEDFATARIDLAEGTTIQLACSWKISAGAEAVISASIYGTNGGAQFRNVNGSFYESRPSDFMEPNESCSPPAWKIGADGRRLIG